MKVYIKPWAEALKCVEKFNKNFINDIEGINKYIFGIPRQYGNWGHIVEAKKDNNDEFDCYTSCCNRANSFTYPACCVEEITPDWLEEHAPKFAEEVITTDSTADTWDKNLDNYETHRITIYKIMDALHSYFFYVKRISYNGYDETVEDFREIK
ncbi:MAG TPA: hypothetical protein DCW90_00460 [Lachnospiraceae bacterium]|nr:hypothetical protein [Lachnospiraceae bacterium]